ncbi:DUF4351 domain-containing protein [Schlesneria sp. T3-172]|uniref:DUF4351 domain-containing protein n=1 Tax=Schlesneria sphaerica TaxID=3373610 RepID=UPI0037CA3E0C
MTNDSISGSQSETPESDYDGAWKELLRSHLRDSVENCFPALAELVDWSFEPQWLDKEISQIVGQSGQKNSEVDVLFKVRLKTGDEQWILCHLEIQTSYEADFAFRLDLYHSGLKWMFRQEILTLVILADLRKSWMPREHRFEMGGFLSHRQFPVCKIVERLESDWVDNVSLVAQVSRAQIAALRTTGDPESRFSAKTELVRNLYTLGYSSDRIRELFRLIDWMMRLRADLDRRFRSDLIAYEEELRMPYVTSVERLAKEEGREEGFLKGSEELLLRQLVRVCGDVPDDLRQKIHRLSLEQSHQLGEALLDFHSLADLEHWLQVSGH